ncbi:MAG: short-chain fatty acid transporter [Nitriliruptorales bacterium]|nr:short-chain fatty acid transporter [Nitriliruptorales bacterium]
MGRGLSAVSARYMPDPMLFALMLSVLVFFLGVVLTDSGPLDMIIHWYEGFWSLLEFAMQMVLILLTGFALATAPGLRDGIRWLARVPNTGRSAVFITALVSTLFTWFHWGLGLIVAAIFALTLAREAAKRGVKVHYPLLGAAAYSGQMVWHVGPSTSAGLLSATEGHLLEDLIGIVPITETAFTPYALLLGGMLVLFVVPITMWAMTPRDDESVGLQVYAPDKLDAGDGGGDGGGSPSRGTPGNSGDATQPAAGPATRTAVEEAQDVEEVAATPADRLENSRIAAALIWVPGLVYVVYWFATRGFDLNLDIFNFAFLSLGLALHGTPIRYIRAIQEAVSGAAGIILQFPFYGGIAGMIGASGLATIMAGGLLAISTPQSFPVVAWLTGGFINIFVPSGGGEWAVVGEVISRTALDLDVPIGKAILAYGVGDMWTNMLQPFWAIPLLGIMGLRARDIIGYTLGLMLVAFPFIFLGLWFFPY